MTKRGKKVATAIGIAVVAASLAFAVWLIDPPEAHAMPETRISGDEVRSLIASIIAGSGIPLWYAMANCQLESGFNARAHNAEGSYGLMQIYWRAHREALARYGITDPEQLYDPETNLRYWRDLVARIAAQEGASLDDPASWERVRLRLAGVRRANFGGATAARILARYRPVAERWRAELGG